MKKWTSSDDKQLSAWMRGFEESDGLIDDDEVTIEAEQIGGAVLMSVEMYCRLTKANHDLGAAGQRWIERARAEETDKRCWQIAFYVLAGLSLGFIGMWGLLS